VYGNFRAKRTTPMSEPAQQGNHDNEASTALPQAKRWTRLPPDQAIVMTGLSVSGLQLQPLGESNSPI
jgi:hypothetical protein